MSILIDQATQRSVLSFTYDFRSTTAGAVVIVLLLAVLLTREIIRVHGGPRAGRRLDALNVVAYPLLLAFAAVVVVRLVSLV